MKRAAGGMGVLARFEVHPMCHSLRCAGESVVRMFA